ncbi:MAG TPA: hypothetical protein DDY13_04430 [Cytophagales bacterium]|nr:hypothetical protein [Cytophagales bacterium]
MIRKYRNTIFYLLLAASFFAFIPLKAQDTDSLLLNDDVSLELIEEYLAFDSLLLAEMTSDTSSFNDILESLIRSAEMPANLMLRLGYTSNIVNAGRDFGFQQHGFSTGLSYYHKNGFFADIYSYWNSNYDPSFNSVTASLGYMHFVKNWTFSANYDHIFYNKTFEEGLEIQYPFNNILNASVFYDVWKLSIGLDYSYLFGNQQAHRIRPTLMGSFNVLKRPSHRITISPFANLLLGDASIVFSEQRYTYRQLIQQIGWGRFLILYRNNPELINEIIFEEYGQNSFGLMNYAFTLPVNYYAGSWAISLSYTLNFPVALPGENINTESNSFLGASICYTISF